MKQLTKTEYILNYDEIKKLINQGYSALSDLKLAMKYNALNKYKEIKVYINHSSKIIDVYGIFHLFPYPYGVEYSRE